MALGSLTDIKAAAMDGIARSDLSSYANDFVTLAEGHFNRDLRHRKMIATTDLTPSSYVCTLPTDFLEAIQVVEKASIRRELTLISPQVADQFYPDRVAGLACDYTIVGSSLRAYPQSANDIELTYYQKIPTLISNDPNWLLTEAPHLYLRGIQMQALLFINETETPRFMATVKLVQQIIDELNSQSEAAQFTGMTMRIKGYTP